MKTEAKTHWLQSPNKNYLGHWDLPDGEDLVLTIESAQWEEVKNPIIGTSEAKRVVRFKEDVKPFICNQTNAQSILRATGIKFMEDSEGKSISLYVSSIKDRKTKEDIDCIRIRNNKLDWDALDSLYQMKKESMSDEYQANAERIIKSKEASSYSKLTKYLKSI